MGRKRKAVEWEPGDPITEDADRVRRKFSPDIGDSEREAYEERLWVIRMGVGRVLSEEQIHAEARSEVVNQRWIRYQRKLGSIQVIEVQQKKTATHTKKMRDVKADKAVRRRIENREEALQAIKWARDHFPTAAADDSVDFLKGKAAAHLGITKRALNNRLKK